MVSLRDRSVAALLASSMSLMLAAQSPAQEDFRFRITDLGVPDNGSESYAHGMNANGEVVGRFIYTASYPYQNHAFLWLPEAAYGLDAGMHDLSDLAGFSGQVLEGRAFDINDDGIVVGRQDTGAYSDVAFVWDLSEYPNDWAYRLGSLGTGGSWDRLDEPGTAYGINNAGPAVVVGEAGEIRLGFQVTLGPQPAMVDLAPLSDFPIDDGSCGYDVNMADPALVVGDSRRNEQ